MPSRCDVVRRGAGAFPNVPSKLRRSARDRAVAAQADALRCVELLLEDPRGRATAASRNDDGDTALHLALGRGDAAAAASLVAAGAPRDVANRDGDTPEALALALGVELAPKIS